jgi:hypothetical protein
LDCWGWPLELGLTVWSFMECHWRHLRHGERNLPTNCNIDDGTFATNLDQLINSCTVPIIMMGYIEYRIDSIDHDCNLITIWLFNIAMENPL